MRSKQGSRGGVRRKNRKSAAETRRADIKGSQSSAAHGRINCRFVLSGGVYVRQNTLHDASVEILHLRCKIYARSIVQLFQTENQRSVFRLRAFQKVFLKSSGRGGDPPRPIYRDGYYLVKLRSKRIRIAATSARVALPFGASVVAVRPLMRPSATAHCTAVFAQAETDDASE